MRKFKSMFLSVAIVAVLGFFFQPVQVRAEGTGGGGGPQNTSNSQSSGGSGPTVADMIRTMVIILHF